jgi:uncharacterized C2H2 Zn-finger protein
MGAKSVVNKSAVAKGEKADCNKTDSDYLIYVRGRHKSSHAKWPSAELVDAIAVCRYCPDPAHPKQPAACDVLVTHGKYVGKPVSSMTHDTSYIEWLGKQPWLRTHYPQLLEALYEVDALKRPETAGPRPASTSRVAAWMKQLDAEGGGTLYGKQSSRGKRCAEPRFGPCTDCGKRFRTSSGFNRHVKKRVCHFKRQAKINRPTKRTAPATTSGGEQATLHSCTGWSCAGGQELEMRREVADVDEQEAPMPTQDDAAGVEPEDSVDDDADANADEEPLDPGDLIDIEEAAEWKQARVEQHQQEVFIEECKSKFTAAKYRRGKLKGQFDETDFRFRRKCPTTSLMCDLSDFLVKDVLVWVPEITWNRFLPHMPCPHCGKVGDKVKCKGWSRNNTRLVIDTEDTHYIISKQYW